MSCFLQDFSFGCIMDYYGVFMQILHVPYHCAALGTTIHVNMFHTLDIIK